MKVIALVPVKNEAWILRFSLANMSLFSDEIILLDDGSTDGSRDIAAEFENVQVLSYDAEEAYVDMSARRNVLLAAGREAGGTHFVFLDADETFSDLAITTLHSRMANMKQGETLCFPWISIVDSNGTWGFDPKEKTLFKDIVYFDNGNDTFAPKALSEDRTPSHDHHFVPFEEGYILHFQQIAKKRYALKQTWYRVNELLEGKRSARRINATYDFTKRSNQKHIEVLSDKFTRAHRQDISSDVDGAMYVERLQRMFDEKGIEHFEALDIWYVPDLQEMFVSIVGREPRPKTFPTFILALNVLKNRVFAFFRK